MSIIIQAGRGGGPGTYCLLKPRQGRRIDRVEERWIRSGPIRVPSGLTLVAVLPARPAGEPGAVQRAARFRYDDPQVGRTTDIRDYWVVPVTVAGAPEPEEAKAPAEAEAPGAGDREPGPAGTGSGSQGT